LNIMKNYNFSQFDIIKYKKRWNYKTGIGSD
jgi:hypothetical protein